MFRDRTNLYISYRQSYSRHPQPYGLDDEQDALISSGGGLGRSSIGGIGGLAGDGRASAEALAIEMDKLPPSWIDVADQVDDILAEIHKNMALLDTLHKRNILPGFDDRSRDEQQIESLTFDITAALHRCQSLIKRFEDLTRNESGAAEINMSANMKISLATKVQETSAEFRRSQSNFLKALRRDVYGEYSSIGGGAGAAGTGATAAGSGTTPFDAVAEEELDVALSENTLQQQQALATSEDQTIRQRENEITKIAQGIIELADIFKDLQNMVIDQGTLLDRIDYNIETMHTNVKQADKELIQGERYQRRTQKCKVILLLVLIIVGLIIVLIVKPKRHHSSSDDNVSQPNRPLAPPQKEQPAATSTN